MRVSLHVVAQDVAAPQAGASALVSHFLDEVPRRRPVTLGYVAHGNTPAAMPTPWVFRGVTDALASGSRQVHEVVGLGAREASTFATDRALPRALTQRSITHGVTPPFQRLTLRGGATVRVPRVWIGSSLVLICPTAHLSQPRGSSANAIGRASFWGASSSAIASSTERWLGPATAALHVLGTHLQPNGAAADPQRNAALAASVCRDVFASVLVVFDATWWGPLDSSGAIAGELLAPELLFATSRIDAADFEAIDAWWAERLRLAAPSAVGSRVDADLAWQATTPARLPEPRRVTAMTTAHGLASRTVAALRAGPTKPTLALAAPVPGSFARLWSSASSVGGGLHRGIRGPT